MVAIAPWGEQPPQSAWDREGLANIHIPSLFISGDHDDVADFENGVKPAFEQAVNSERYLLVYENARHNTGGNPPTPGAILDYRGIESLEEPVWRKERIVEINQHFITAFLDLYVKGIESRRSYLRVPFVKSNDGKWDLPPGPHDDSALSTGTDANGSSAGGLLAWRCTICLRQRLFTGNNSGRYSDFTSNTAASKSAKNSACSASTARLTSTSATTKLKFNNDAPCEIIRTFTSPSARNTRAATPGV
jgi:hypothetical protein